MYDGVFCCMRGTAYVIWDGGVGSECCIRDRKGLEVRGGPGAQKGLEVRCGPEAQRGLEVRCGPEATTGLAVRCGPEA